MAYEPTKQVIDTRFIGRNILAYIEATQEEALKWANGGTDLVLFQQFADSLANRLKPVLPSIAIADDSGAFEISDGDVPQSAYAITFEAQIGSADPNGLFIKAKKYAFALESMLLNISATAILADSAGLVSAKPFILETDFDEIKGNKPQWNSFMQMFQTKATFLLTAEKY